MTWMATEKESSTEERPDMGGWNRNIEWILVGQRDMTYRCSLLRMVVSKILDTGLRLAFVQSSDCLVVALNLCVCVCVCVMCPLVVVACLYLHVMCSAWRNVFY